ncbi:MAG: squalene/phytoene synthase family protein, partial [Candidatus Velthaea sp.]
MSRTFALGIRLLPRTLAAPVTVGYLLCRIADTVEDDRAIGAARKALLLAAFVDAFADAAAAAQFAAKADGTGMTESDRALIAGAGHVFAAFRALDPQSRRILTEWVGELTHGMMRFVDAYPDGIRIVSIEEFRRYCYYVAGTVGHLLTDLWHAHSPFVGARTYARLLAHCEAFGEALQTVNILKDIPWDVERENAVYIPRDLLAAAGSDHHHLLDPALRSENRAALDALLALAEDDLQSAIKYVSAIPPPAMRIRLFCVL